MKVHPSQKFIAKLQPSYCYGQWNYSTDSQKNQQKRSVQRQHIAKPTRLVILPK